LISKDDLKGYTPKWRTPVQISYRGYTIYSMPPASSGGVTLGEILNIMEGYDTLPPFGSAGYVHLEAEAMRRAFMDRNHWLGDPDFIEMPLERLLSKSYAAELRAQILPDHATPTPPVTTSGNEGTETTHHSIVNVVDHGMSLVEAVAAPRVHQQALPDVVFYERGGLAQATLDGLRTMGYQLRERGRMGDIAAIERTAAGWIGVADPRRGGGAVGF